MRLALAVHGYPPEGVGGTERSVQALARALARRGHDVLVLSGSARRAEGAGVQLERSLDSDPLSGARVEVLRLLRPDLYFDHWMKSLAPAVSVAVRSALAERRCEVLHVHHWLRLSRDLVRAAALEGVPALVALNDTWASCPLAFRVRPDTRAGCDVPAGPHPCVACAGQVPPRTPWVATDQAWMAFAERQRDLARELELARLVTAPTAAHAADMERFLGAAPGALAARVVPPARERCTAAPAPAPTAPHAQGRLVLACWGGIAEHKGVDLVLDALERSPARDRIELHLLGAAGDPGYEHDLRNRACGLRVHFAGPYEPADLSRGPAARAHALVSGSRARESYGLTLDEAFELGRPVVAPGCEAFVERARAGGVLLYEAGDPVALAAVLARLLDESALWPRLAAEARARGDALAGADAVAERVEALYVETAAAGAPDVRPPEWFEARLAEEAARAWDESLSRCGAAQLGIAEPGVEP